VAPADLERFDRDPEVRENLPVVPLDAAEPVEVGVEHERLHRVRSRSGTIFFFHGRPATPPEPRRIHPRVD
jgi:hypothetical protein